MGLCSSCGVDNTVIPTSAQDSVNNIYRPRFSSKNYVTFTLVWSKTQTPHSSSLSVKINNRPVSIKGPNGSTSCIMDTCIIGICWDFSSATYNNKGPEPLSNFYVVITYDEEFALLVGDRCEEIVRSFKEDVKNDYSVANFSMIAKKVKVYGSKSKAYSTKVNFCGEIGKEHDIKLAFEGESEMLPHLVGKKVMHARKLRWNFRGNGTFDVDEVVVYVTWDLYRWMFRDPKGYASVQLRTNVNK